MSHEPAADPAGAETLEIMRAAPRYNAWQYERIAPFIGRRVLEVGSGVGNISQHIVSAGRELVILTDTDEYYRQELRARFSGRGNVLVDSLTLPDPGAAARFRDSRLDTVIALNVVEHIEDDVGALRTMGEMVTRGGRVIILVPALPWLYGSLDTELQHYRRYSSGHLTTVVGAAGLALDKLFWFNAVGVAGWWLNAVVRRAPRIPLDQLKAFDRLVPLLRFEDRLPLPFGQSLIAVCSRP